MQRLLTTLNDLLLAREHGHGDALVFRYLSDGEVDGAIAELRYGELASQARAIAGSLQAAGLAGQRALLLYPPGLEFIAAFFACSLAGVVAVPATPPDPQRLDRTLPRLAAIVADSRATVVLTTRPILALAAVLPREAPALAALRWLATDDLARSPTGAWCAPQVSADAVALLQYTSGSTASPRGVAVTHGNLMHNLAVICASFAARAETPAVFWLPMYHDLGLIGGMLGTVYAAMTTTLMSPLAFLARPARWLAAISRTRAQVSGGPNFAFDLCVRKVSDAEKQTLDLSSWELAFSGAEPIRHDTLHRFARAFEPCGFRSRALFPCYGLAESTVFVTGGARGEGATTLVVSPDALAAGTVELAARDGRTLVGCGRTWGDHAVRVVDPATGRIVDPARVGEIWVAGPSVASGYWDRPEVTAEVFGATLPGDDRCWLRTGDLGFVHDDQLYVVGRIKDVIIVRGKNYYPQDLELGIERAARAVRPGCSAAFSVEHARGEDVVIVAEVRKGSEDLGAVARAVRDAVAAEHGLIVAQVALVAPGSLPKTSSGKIQRSACRAALAAGELPVLHVERHAPDRRELAFSVMLFATDEAAVTEHKYALALDAARAADRMAFEAIWVPERHFHPFGGLYPNPALLCATFATITERVRLRAGSVVLPLHEPLRVAEDWSVIDQLSNGRVDVAFATGWNPNDFVLAPDRFEHRRAHTFAAIETVRRAWRGEPVTAQNGAGAETAIQIYPRPKQPTIPVWLTCTGGEDRFAEAGERGYNVLTALLFQSVDELARKIARYRAARSAHDGAPGRVTVMLHSYLADDLAEAHATVRRPLIDYLASSIDLWRSQDQRLDDLAPERRAAVLEAAFERYVRTSALVGTPSSCRPLLDRLAAIGVDEIACLIDFGVARDAVLASLERIDRLRTSPAAAPPQPEPPARRAAAAEVGSGPHEVSARLRAAPPADRLALASAALQAELVAVLGEAAPGADTTPLQLDSLHVVELLSRIADRTGCKLPPAAAYEHRTVRALAGRLLAELGLPAAAERSPMSSSQRRLWFVEREAPGTALYHVHFGLRIAGAVDSAILARCLAALAERHPILRTTLHDQDGERWQLAHPAPAWSLAVEDLRAQPDPERAFHQASDAQARQPFDFERGPLVRARLCRLADEHAVLVMTAHHMVMDGWSQGVIGAELVAMYRALAGGEPIDLPPPACTFAAWCEAEQAWLRGPEAAAQRAYWAARLAGLPRLALPGARAPAGPRSRHGGHVAVRLSAAHTSALAQLATREGVSLYALVLAGYAIVLGRSCGQLDVPIGTAVANRARPEHRGVVGFVANTVVLRCDLAGEPTVLELARRLAATTIEALQHQELPFDEVTRAVRAGDRDPLLRAMFVLESIPAPISDAGRTWSVYLEQANAAVTGLARFDLGLALAEGPDGLWGGFAYAVDVLEPAAVEALASELTRVLEAIAAAPTARISAVPPVAVAALASCRGPRVELSDACIHRQIELQVARSPEAIAVTDGDAQLTYRALDQRANRLARCLRDHGVGPDALVGVCVTRSVDLVIALLGVLKAGAAYVPLDPELPVERIAFQLADARIGVIVGDARHEPRFASSGLPAIIVDRDAAAIAARSDDPLDVAVDPAHLMYAIYTSGSTGEPKAAENTHRALSNRLAWMQRTFQLGASDRVLHKTSYAFDVSVWELFWPLLAGARLVIARPDGQRDPRYLARVIDEQEITTLHFVPAMLDAFLATNGDARHPSLRRVICSGEELPRGVVDRWYARHAVDLFNLYGPTEAAIDVSWFACDRGGTGRVPIGRPIDNTELYVLDTAGQPVAPGAAGELYIGGAGLARGYLHRPELTARAFVPDHLGATPGGRLYRTGDRCRYRDDGNLEFLGRVDRQVKLRGHRIELGEIEAALGRDANVRACAVSVREVAGDPRLIAYVVYAGPHGSAGAVRDGLARWLPASMVPSTIVAVDALPVTANGKLDHRALAALPLGEAASPAAPPREAGDDLESFVLDTVRSLLGNAAIGLHDDFFAAGGHSMLAMELTRRLEQRLAHTVHITVVYDAPTVASLTRRLRSDAAPSVAGLPAHAVGARSADPPAELRRLIAARPDRSAPPRGPVTALRRTVFVLSPPRSGSTLLRVMLAGHPALFAPPELELLGFASLADRRAAFHGGNAFQGEGLVRAVMAACRVPAERARALVASWEASDLAVDEAYRRLLDHVGDRILVDKTPSYALDADALTRAERYFDAPIYLQLTRHPHAMIDSFERARMEQVIFRHPHGLRARELAEAVWTVSHENIAALFARVPAHRRTTIAFEQLVAEPASVLRQICDVIGIAYDPAMLEPYDGSAARMTDGPTAMSRMHGDVRFHEHRAIDPAVAGRWRARAETIELAPATREVAARLGYAPPATPVAPAAPVAPAIDWGAEARLGSLELAVAEQPAWWRDVLLTGVTGFVGAHLVRELLDRTLADVHCLVRGRDAADGARRIEQALAQYALWRPEDAIRLHPVIGDLGAPRLGLAPAVYERLATRLDAIYNVGARVNFVAPYRDLSAVNAEGTRELIRLAARHRRTPIHHVSTFAALAPSGVEIEEVKRAADPDLLVSGYGQSKAIAEHLLDAARDAGLPVTVYRLGPVTGHSRTGMWSTDAVVGKLIKGCIQLGAVPRELMSLPVAWAPIDFVTRAIAELSVRPTPPRPYFHLCNPTRVAAGTVVGWLEELGFTLPARPYPEWRAALADARARKQTNALHPLSALFPEGIEDISRSPAYRSWSVPVSTRHTSFALADTVTCPPLDRSLIEVYVRYLQRIGFLPHPARALARTGERTS